MLDYRLRPMSDKSWLDQVPKRAPGFKRDWPEMQTVLGYEIDRLNGYDLTIDVDAPAESLTARGGIRRGAIVWSPAVIVAFETDDHGEMVLKCDRYRVAEWGPRSTLATAWQSNVYAVALHLEGLRDIERHGVARGEQYDAYKALPSGSPATVAAMSAESAIETLLQYGRVEGLTSWPFLPDAQRKIVKRARRALHPDMNDGRRLPEADAVDQAVQTLITAGVLPAGT